MENDMSHNDKYLMLHAANEIKMLRRSNEILGAKVEVMELFGMALRASPGNGLNCMSEDIVWRLEQRAEEIASAQGNARETQS